jgi:metal-responsive CopG/Arc/MetJ family transcriptional regulator
MPAKKIAISLSRETLELVDRLAAEEGVSRSAWFERAAQRARRRKALEQVLREARKLGVKPATDRELESLRRELSRASWEHVPRVRTNLSGHVVQPPLKGQLPRLGISERGLTGR